VDPPPRIFDLHWGRGVSLLYDLPTGDKVISASNGGAEAARKAALRSPRPRAASCPVRPKGDEQEFDIVADRQLQIAKRPVGRKTRFVGELCAQPAIWLADALA